MKDNFCISPWVNFTLFPNGDVRPCCVAQETYGNLNQDKLENIINSQKAVKFRELFLKNEIPASCEHCIISETSGRVSLRQDLNNRFLQEGDKKKFKNTIENFEPLYLDLRDTNLCNFKCRICHHDLSSSWWEDTKEISPNYSQPKIIQAQLNIKNFLEQNLTNCKEIYFAGGEPLLNNNHLEILKELDRRQMFDVKLLYNTNLSLLEHRGESYIKFWKKFKDVSLGISIDDIGTAAEYSRKGTNWKVIEKNINSLSKNQLNYYFLVSISMFNIFHLKELFQFLQAYQKDIRVNLVNWPEFYNIKHLPEELKEAVLFNINEIKKDFSNYKDEFEIIENAITQPRDDYQFKIFIHKVKELDQIRGEKLTDNCPEFSRFY